MTDRCNVIAPPSVCGREQGHDGAHISNTPAWPNQSLLDKMATELRSVHGDHGRECAIRVLLDEYDALRQA